MSEDFWVSSDGWLLRILMLNHLVQWLTFNDAVLTEAEKVGYKKFIIAGPLDERCCDWCAEHVDQIYTASQFMPDLPKHINCRHWWDVVLEA